MNTETFIENTFTLNAYPVAGSSFINPDGKFVCLRRVNYDHEKLLKELENNGIKRSVNEFEELRQKGYIRLNDGIDNGYAYIEVYDLEPTPEQYRALNSYATHLKSKKVESLTVVIDTKNDFLDKEFTDNKWIDYITGYFAIMNYQRLINNHIDGEICIDWFHNLKRTCVCNRISVKDGLTNLIFVGLEDFIWEDIIKLCKLFKIPHKPVIMVERWWHIPVMCYALEIAHNTLNEREKKLHSSIDLYAFEDYIKKYYDNQQSKEILDQVNKQLNGLYGG